MNINTFAKAVCVIEGGKKPVSIAQVKEVLSCVNLLTRRKFYKMIREMKECEWDDNGLTWRVDTNEKIT